jgi:predicted small secreted protein
MNDNDTGRTMRSVTALMTTALTVLLLTGCGTASGLAEGTGRVFEGVGEDFRSLGGAIRR